MSTSAEIVDELTFNESLASVRNDGTEDKYVILGHKYDDPLKCEVVKVGQNVEDLPTAMDDGQVAYILARYKSTFDMSTTVKFVYFRWVGDSVPYVKRGKFGVIHGSVQDRFNPYHLFIETSSKDDFAEDKIVQLLEETTGKTSKVVEGVGGRQERGFTASQLPRRDVQGRSGPQVSSAGAAVEIAEEVATAVAAVRSNDDPTRWVLAEYRNCNSKGPIVLTSSGAGDCEEFTANLKDDTPMYGLYRVTDVVDNITTVKFVFVIWVGMNVKPMMKAKLSTHKGTVEEAFGQFHVAIFASDLSDISEKIIMEKVTSASGTRSNVK